MINILFTEPLFQLHPSLVDCRLQTLCDFAHLLAVFKKRTCQLPRGSDLASEVLKKEKCGIVATQELFLV